jgi:hypothetical protein
LFVASILRRAVLFPRNLSVISKLHFYNSVSERDFIKFLCVEADQLSSAVRRSLIGRASRSLIDSFFFFFFVLIVAAHEWVEIELLLQVYSARACPPRNV